MVAKTKRVKSVRQWFSDPPVASLKWRDSPIAGRIGVLCFSGPDGVPADVFVTEGIAYRHASDRYHVWHIEVDEQAGIATVSPSIDYEGHFHTPNPVTFKLGQVVQPETAA